MSQTDARKFDGHCQTFPDHNLSPTLSRTKRIKRGGSELILNSSSRPPKSNHAIVSNFYHDMLDFWQPRKPSEACWPDAEMEKHVKPSGNDSGRRHRDPENCAVASALFSLPASNVEIRLALRQFSFSALQESGKHAAGSPEIRVSAALISISYRSDLWCRRWGNRWWITPLMTGSTVTGGDAET